MRKLYVLYDHTCAFCRSCRDWLDGQAKFIEMEFIAASSPKALDMFPGIDGPRGCVDQICSSEFLLEKEAPEPVGKRNIPEAVEIQIPERCPHCKMKASEIQRLYRHSECRYCGTDMLTGVNKIWGTTTENAVTKTKKKMIEAPSELIVISDEGGVYRGGQAFIICLYALENYREISEDLATPAMLPWARRGFELLSKNRGVFSTLLTLGGERIDAKEARQQLTAV